MAQAVLTSITRRGVAAGLAFNIKGRDELLKRMTEVTASFAKKAAE